MLRRAAAVCALVLAGAAPVAAGAAVGKTTPAQMRTIVREWSKHLNSGQNRALAQLFSTPAIVVQGGNAYRLVNAAQVALYFEGLPCSGKVVSVTIQGRFATAVFVLGNDRPGRRCDAPGQQAAAKFEIVKGKIRLWQQVPVPSDSKGA